jgi:hypothetical protein
MARLLVKAVGCCWAAAPLFIGSRSGVVCFNDLGQFYSQNFNEYPSWSDDVHVLILSACTIETFKSYN